MRHPPVARIPLYHLTDLANLSGIIEAGGLLSDAAMRDRPHHVLGYGHIKRRRLSEIHIPCCGGCPVGACVPFHFCPRSPMLYAIHAGATGLPTGSQANILHLVGSLALGIGLGRPWAISDGNAGAFHTTFSSDLAFLEDLDWDAITAHFWQGRTHRKSAEFLVRDFYPWGGILGIGCHDHEAASRVRAIIRDLTHQPKVAVKPDGYYP